MRYAAGKGFAQMEQTDTHTDRQTDLIHIYIHTQALTGTTTRSARAIDGMESLF